MPIELSVSSLPTQELGLTNSIYVSVDDFLAIAGQAAPHLGATPQQLAKTGVNVSLNKSLVYNAKPLPEISRGCVGLGAMQRQSANVSMNQNIQVSVFLPNTTNFALASLSFEIQLLVRGQVREARVVDCEAIVETFKSQFNNQVFLVGQLMALDLAGTLIRLKVIALQHAVVAEEKLANSSDLSPLGRCGQYIKETSLIFSKAKDAPVKLIGQSSSTAHRIFRPDFDFSKLGIGGLDKEFNDIFRRAFASRVFPQNIVQQLGINHVRGMLLFGPPGCGKTLIARQIGKVLNAKEPKIVNGPEVLDKYVGEAERKIRDLFSDARREQEELGDDSELHIIIFDEIDAICKARGGSRDSSGIGDSVVNQLLTQIDGVDSLNNVLVIGMTNRKDMLDEALLRPGRLEVQMEINLPDEHGRGQILKIHTSKAKESGFLSKQVEMDLESCFDPAKKIPEKQNLAQRTKNFSGAEIEGLVRAATAHSLSRGTDGKTFHAIENFKPEIRMEDFDLALEEVIPKFGSPTGDLEQLFRNGIISFGTAFKNIQDTLMSVIKQVETSSKTSLMSVMLHGGSGTGKSALAAYCAVVSEFPLVRRISATDFIGMQESAKCSQLYKTFQEAYRSPLSMIIIDDIERLLEYVALGPRFSNQVLQALMVLIKHPPPVPSRKLIIVGITSAYEEMVDLSLVDVFDISLEVPKLSTPEEIKIALQESQIELADRDIGDIVATFSQPIGIKKLLLVIELASDEGQLITSARLMECMLKFGF